MTAEATSTPKRVRVWDLPVRVTHWTIAALFGFQWWSGDTGRLEWHRWAGYAVMGLIAFRLLWGLFGSSTARFAGFVRGPRAVIAYARQLLTPGGKRRFRIGHNPLGGWSILLMLGLLTVQAGLGMFSIDTDGLESGPLAAKVSFETARTLAHRHALVFNLLLAVVALHILAAVFYLAFRRENLIGPMITGARRGETEDAPLAPAGPIRLLLAAAAGLAVSLWASKGFAPLRT